MKKFAARKDIYHQPTAQDWEGTGIRPEKAGEIRSEDVYPPFVLGPRRTIDSLTRQAYELLPLAVRQSTAFVISDRLAQYPDAYLNYIKSRPQFVVTGSLVGIGTADTYDDWAVERHNNELWQLDMSLALAQALGKRVTGVLYSMGDSSGKAAATVRQNLNNRLQAMLKKYGIENLYVPLTWGADEMAIIGFASQLPSMTAVVTYGNPDARQYYDGMRPASEIFPEKARQAGVRLVANGADIEVALLTRRPGGSVDDYEAGDTAQLAQDKRLLDPFKSYSVAQKNKLVIMDSRLFNGGWSPNPIPVSCDYLGVSAWGTFGNNTGSALAMAKIHFFAKDDGARKQLLLESFAHDFFANGYEEAQRGALAAKINAAGVPFSHFNGYDTAKNVTTVFGVVNSFVNARMQSFFTGTDCVKGMDFRFTPQLWRTFESEVHARPALSEKLSVHGVYRKDLPADVFNPGKGDLRLLDVKALEKVP